MPETKRIVLSGGPGTGKTSIINELANRGYRVFHEISRQIIQEELAINGRNLPWDNLEGFSQKVLSGRLDDYKNADGKWCFYDRSIVDAAAYLHHDGQNVGPEWYTLFEQNRYFGTVFITPPWRSIFVNDAERKETWEQLQSIHQHLVATYKKAGYNVEILPELPIAERTNFLLNKLDGAA